VSFDDTAGSELTGIDDDVGREVLGGVELAVRRARGKKRDREHRAAYQYGGADEVLQVHPVHLGAASDVETGLTNTVTYALA